MAYKFETVDEYIHYINTSPEYNVKSPRDCAVFYSGIYAGMLNRRRAEALVQNDKRFVTINDTEGGEFLWGEDLEKRFKEKDVERIWSAASCRFARECEGEVRAFVTNAEEGRVFCKTELPELLFNDKVTGINVTSRRELLAHYNTHSDELEGYREVHIRISVPRTEVTYEPLEPQVSREERISLMRSQIDVKISALSLPNVPARGLGRGIAQNREPRSHDYGVDR